MAYKWCVVPQCTNTSIRNPQKLFVSVPTNRNRRKIWLQLAGRNPNEIASHSNVFMCEDHFCMEKDISNYMQYKMGFSQNILLTNEAVPSKFHCQTDRNRFLSNDRSPRDVALKRKRIGLVRKCLQSKSAARSQTESLKSDDNIKQEIIQPEEIPTSHDGKTLTDSIVTTKKSVQTRSHINIHYGNKAVQILCQNKSISTSPLKETVLSSFTAPIKMESSQMLDVKKDEKDIVLLEEISDIAISYCESGLPSLFAGTSSRVTASDNVEQLQSLKNIVPLIEKNPLLYLGISKECYFLVDLLHKHTNIKIEFILLCLKKIRMNTIFSELKDNFGMSLSNANKLFLVNIPLMSSVLKPFIVKMEECLVKKNLSFPFRRNYHHVSCIIHCLEYSIQKPSRPAHRALTWSENKKRYTVKYLIACKPDGLINFISQGFGGNASDVTIVKTCKFLDELELGSCVLAGRGFRNIEQILHEKGMKLLRVNTGGLRKMEDGQAKLIASMRIHIEHTIRRLNKFQMLKRHSVINANTLGVLDHVIIIACALINIQKTF